MLYVNFVISVKLMILLVSGKPVMLFRGFHIFHLLPNKYSTSITYFRTVKKLTD